MQTAVNNIDSNSPTLSDISLGRNCVQNELFSMEMPNIFLSTTTTITSTTNAENATMDEHDCWQHSNNVESMSITPSTSALETPSKKIRRHHRKTSPQYSIARQDYMNITINKNNTSSSSCTSSTSDISVINNFANNTKTKHNLNTKSINNGCTLGTSGVLHDEVQRSSVNSKFLPIPPQTLSIMTYGDQYYSGLSDGGGNSENSSPLAPSTTPSVGTSSHSSSNISTPNAIDAQFTKKNAQDGTLELLQWKDMPQYLQFNPYVLRGYRPLQTFRDCLLSLFYWHNETINILTHGEF